eukprot:jgi/Tetstr1/463958/TSEL_008763.t1
MATDGEEAVALTAWRDVHGAGGAPLTDHAGVERTDWFVDQRGRAWVPQSWLCSAGNASKYISDKLCKLPNPHVSRSVLVRVSGDGAEPETIVPRDTPAALAIREVVARLRDAVGVRPSDWASRCSAVAALRLLGSREAFVAVVNDAGWGDMLAETRPAPRAAGADPGFFSHHAETLKRALRPVVHAMGVQTHPGRYPKGLKQLMRARLTVGGRHWSKYLTNQRKKSVREAADEGERLGARDQQLMSMMRNWRKWRPRVAAALPSIRRELANVAVDGRPMAEVLGLDDEARLAPELPTLLELLRAAPVILTIRGMAWWKRGKDAEGKNVNNAHLRALVTTRRGGGGARDADPNTYSLVRALWRALPAHREEIDMWDGINHVVTDAQDRRLELEEEAKHLPHPVTWIWYVHQMEEHFWGALARSGRTMSAAETLRIVLCCQLSGAIMSPTRTEEIDMLTMPGQPCEECQAAGCHGNRVMLSGEENRSHLLVSHWKTEGSARRAHRIAIPDSMAALFREWFGWARGYCMSYAGEGRDHGRVLCSTRGARVNPSYTISQAKALLESIDVDVSDWGDLSNVRHVRTVCLRRVAGPEGFPWWINEAHKREQAERGEPETGIQGGMTGSQLLAVYELLVDTGRTSVAQAEQHYTSSVRKHTEMGESLELVRKHFVRDAKEPPVRTDMTTRVGRRYPKTSANAAAKRDRERDQKWEDCERVLSAPSGE